MPIMVQCSGCGGKFRASDKAAGKRVKCPTCSAFIDVNGAQTQVPTVPAAAERVPSQQPQDNSFTPGATSEKTELRWARAVWAGGGAIAFILLVACLWFFLLNDSI